jgi:hypothetical protein
MGDDAETTEEPYGEFENEAEDAPADAVDEDAYGDDLVVGDVDDEAAADAAPDVYLDVPVLNVEEVNLEVENLRARVSLQAEVLDLLKLNVGTDVDLGHVQLNIKGVEAQAQLTVHLHHVASILNRVLTTIDRNPQILEQVARGASAALQEVGSGAGRAAGELGKGAGTAVEQVGQGTGTAVERVGEGAGEAVEDVGESAGEAVEDVGRVAEEAGEGVGRSTEEAAGAAGRTAGKAVEDADQDSGEYEDDVEEDRERTSRPAETSDRNKRRTGEIAGTAKARTRKSPMRKSTAGRTRHSDSEPDAPRRRPAHRRERS